MATKSGLAQRKDIRQGKTLWLVTVAVNALGIWFPIQPTACRIKSVRDLPAIRMFGLSCTTIPQDRYFTSYKAALRYGRNIIGQRDPYYCYPPNPTAEHRSWHSRQKRKLEKRLKQLAQ